jgi:hypothetical protein
MKHITLLSSLLAAGALAAQTEVTISTAAGNTQQVYYSLATDAEHAVPLAEWDLAFQINGFESSILVNTAKGDKVFHTGVGVSDWASITAPDEEAWTEINNSETHWSKGALTYGNDIDDDGFNLGWGTYNMATHAVMGTEVYAVQLSNGTWKKLRIDGLIGGVYMFTYADLDGSQEVEAQLVKGDFSTKVFGYWDMTANAAVDHEPASADWDLLFTKYLSDLGVMWYGVAGVLQHPSVTVAQLDGVDPVSVDWLAADGQFSAEINTIGSDWKSYNGTAYEYPADRVYFVKDVAGNVWKLIFTGYGGAATGTMTFTKELVSATSVNEIASAGTAVVYPNPVEGGRAQLLLDLPASEAFVTVLDMNGKQVHAERLTGIVPMSVHPIGLDGLATGTYLLRVQHMAGVTTSKLIVR